MPNFSDPRFEHMRTYMTGEYPYVQVFDLELGKIHARVRGWVQGELFIEYPPNGARLVYNGRLDVKWVPTLAATRIRRADSIWRGTEDDPTWHQREDAKISYWADPWTASLPESD
ncbi:hypothetical protein [Glutamicibacter sp. M10]|uniref:hypothetical protein n=1 Tax=Glutamicibacter sp. M10 TaxID=3023076 RepID=UPI0021C6B982|nr:hypothetical protein [Glutamicibacter sp. M10]UXN31029.1 hypothetical protein N6V40_11420 [Glutamicibacter sp. M10]